MKKIIRATVVPPNVQSAYYAICIFGGSRVNVGTWIEPVEVFGIDVEEFIIGRELLIEQGIDLEVNSDIERRMIKEYETQQLKG